MYDKTNPDWVPSLKIGLRLTTPQIRNVTLDCSCERKETMEAAEDSADDEDLETGVACQTHIHVDMVDVSCQTDAGMFAKGQSVPSN